MCIRDSNSIGPGPSLRLPLLGLRLPQCRIILIRRIILYCKSYSSKKDYLLFYRKLKRFKLNTPVNLILCMDFIVSRLNVASLLIYALCTNGKQLLYLMYILIDDAVTRTDAVAVYFYIPIYIPFIYTNLLFP